ncbi:MAG: tRNA (adenosine(37)-N6)-threonylcarbamoyltransferase complex transferase subunit TsaD [Patescibacteria group bacterium]|nr:tRNA (adenosine(37)-N6)-threonylcarbamoyltransferase complex transferase subunit TsaD [Patescibacteria group bacterium]
MRILAIETSCDETAVALLECTGGLDDARFAVLGNSLDSQAAKHAEFGGVYPTLAKREHQQNLAPLIAGVLRQAGMAKEPGSAAPAEALANIRDDAFKKSVETFLAAHAKPDIDLIAVTHGPGLEPALWTGINFAEALAKTWGLPLFGIDHMEGHLIGALLSSVPKGADGVDPYVLKPFAFPLLALLISGGHTELILMKEWFSYERIGATKDDALGEAFDKVARLLSLPYPGGPHIAASAARSRARGGTAITFPRPMVNDATCDFSFSGLKTAVLYKLREMEEISEEDKEAIAQAFEDAARDTVVSKTLRAIDLTHPHALVLGGGVSANAEIRHAIETRVQERHPDVSVLLPEWELTGDNGIMIGAAAYLRYLSGKESDMELQALGSLVLE